MSAAPKTWDAERASLRMQITNLERQKHDLEGRLFDALKTDSVLREGLEQVDHAVNISRGVYSMVLDVAAVHVAHTKLLVEALRPFANFACSPAGQCDCHNCRARAAIAKATGSAS